jgi:hypothetical protein
MKKLIYFLSLNVFIGEGGSTGSGSSSFPF